MKYKKLLFIILGLIAINSYFLITVIIQKPVENKLKVIFFDVGQGDVSLVMAEKGINILIDGGPDEKIIEKLDKYLPIYNKKIDILVLTHPHADHVSGFVNVLEKYPAQEVWMTGVLHTSPEYLVFLEMVRDKKIQAKIIDRTDSINISENTKIEILYPNKNLLQQKVDDLNNSSIVLRISYKAKSFLFTGDIEKEAEEELSELAIIKSDVLKVAHHGSNTSSTEKFLNMVNPDIAIISLGENNFGMPSLRILKRLERIGAVIYRTDENGDIVIETDGEEIRRLVN
ncbi:ComEC/Rec2 family competence protein [Patescibacteria group bacterium]